MKEQIKNYFNTSKFLTKVIASALVILVCGVSATKVYSMNQFKMKITYKDVEFNASDNVEKKLFFNNTGDSVLKFEIDLSEYFEEIIKGGATAPFDMPFDVEATLKDVSELEAKLRSTSLVVSAINEIDNGRGFEGKYEVELEVPVGSHNDLVEVRIDIKDTNSWGINSDFEKVFGVIRDIDEPVIIINGISSNLICTNEIEISINEEYKETSSINVNITSDSGNVSINGDHVGTEIIKYKPSKDGEYTGTITVKDAAGNVKSENITFHVNKNAPTIKYNNESIQSFYKEDKMIVSIHDDSKIDLTESKYILTTPSKSKIEGQFASVGSNNKSAEIELDLLEEGEYSLEIKAVDLLGTSTNPENKFVVDRTIPNMVIEGIENDKIYRDTKKMKISLVEENILEKTATIKRNDEQPINIELKKSGNTYTAEYDIVDSGNYVIEVYCKDNAYNSDRKTVNFTIDKDGPKLIFNGIEDGKHYYSDKDLIIEVSDDNFDKVTIVESNKVDGYDLAPKSYDIGSFIEVNVKESKLQHTFNEDGQYKVKINVVDKAGNEVEDEISFVIDKTLPVINIGGVEDDKIYDTEKEVTIAVNETWYKDHTVSIKVNSIDTTNGDGMDYPKWESTSVNSEVTYKFNEGNYVLEVLVQDKYGAEKATKKVGFMVDKAPPQIEINEGENIKNPPHYNEDKKVSFKVTDGNHKSNKLIISKDSKIVEELEIPVNDDIATIEYTFKDDGDYIADVISKDAAEKESKKSILFTIDKVKPQLTIKDVDSNVDIENGKHYKENKKIQVELFDLNHDIYDITVLKNNEEYVVDELEVDGNNVVVTHNFTEDGSYKVVAKAIDKAGNELTEKIETSFVIDKTNPVVTINNYYNLNNSFNKHVDQVRVSIDELNFDKNNVSAIISFTTPEGEQSNLTLNNLDINKVNDKYEFVLKDIVNGDQRYFNEEGIYEIKILCKDIAGNEADIEENRPVKFTVDSTRPMIEILGVSNDEYYNMDRDVTIRNTDFNHEKNNVIVTKDSNTYSVGEFYGDNNDRVLKHRFTQEGIYEIKVISVDKSGNASEENMKFEIDKTAPVITPIVKGEGRTIINDEYINKIFTPEFKLDKPEDDKIDLITLNGEGNLANAVPMASTEMVYNYTVVASDKAKNSTTLKISFTLDTTMPEIKITGIVSGFFSENMVPVYEITDTNINNDKTVVTLNGNAFASGTKVEEQNHYNLKFVGTDLANNVNSKTIEFAIDKDKPVIRFTQAMSGEYFNSDFIPNFIIDDLTDYTIIAMTLNGVDYEEGQLITEEGKHVLYIEVKDKAGNIQSLSIEFILDKTAPKFIIDGVKDKGTYYSTVNAAIKLDNPQDTVKSMTLNGELVEGDVKDEFGQQVFKLDFSEIQKYELKLTATDLAGNLTEDVIEFEIKKKNLFVKFYENKGIFYPTTIVLIGGVSFFVISLIRKSKKVKEKENQE